MKKVLSILISMVLLFTMAAGCGGKTAGSAASEVEIKLPVSTGTRAVVEGEAVISTQVYLLARAYFEKLENYDMDSFSASEYSDLLARSVEAFRIAGAFCTSFEKHAGQLAQAEESGAAAQEKASYKELSASAGVTAHSPFVLVAYAAGKKSAALQYAEELTKTFDNAKSGQKLKTIAEKYGTDVKKAKVMLEQAQAVLEGAAYEDQAAVENKCYQLAVETKAACSTAVFLISTATTGGFTAAGSASFSGLMEVGGVAFNGVSAVIDAGTAATIYSSNGEGNEYTAAWDKTAEMVAPVAAVFSIGGGIQNYKDFRDPAKAEQALENAAQACLVGFGTARDYFQDGTVLGVSSNIIDGYRQIIARSADAGTDAAKEVLQDTGISEETPAEKAEDGSAAQAAEGLGTDGDAYIKAMGSLADPADPLDVEAILEKVDEAFTEYAAQEGIELAAADTKAAKEGNEAAESAAEEAETAAEAVAAEEVGAEEAGTEEETAETEVQEEGIGNAPAITELAGTYAFEGEGGTWTQYVTVVDGSHLQFVDAEDPEAVIVSEYDASTGTFVYSEGGEGLSASTKVTFTDTGDGIRAVMILSFTMGDSTVSTTGTAMKE